MQYRNGIPFSKQIVKLLLMIKRIFFYGDITKGMPLEWNYIGVNIVFFFFFFFFFLIFKIY